MCTGYPPGILTQRCDLTKDTYKVLSSFRTAWLTGFPQLDEDDWDIWGPTFSRLVSVQDHPTV